MSKKVNQREVTVISNEWLNEMMNDFPHEREIAPNCLSEEELNEMLQAFEKEESDA